MSGKKPEMEAPRGGHKIAAAARREFDQLEADAIADPSRLKDYIRELVPRRNPRLWRRFFLLAGSDGLAVLDAEFIDSSYIENVRTAEANGGQTPNYHVHVIEKMTEWIQGAIQLKRASLAPRGTATCNCSTCNNTTETYPDPNTDFKTYRLWCNFCRNYRTWSCEICDQAMRCIRDDKQFLQLECLKCGYGYRFAEPVRQNAPRTDEGWKLLGDITMLSPGTLGRNPRKVIEVVNHYEEHKELIEQNPQALALNLRDIGIVARKADLIASLQLQKFVSTRETIGYQYTP